MKTHRFIDDSIDLDVSTLPLSLRKFIAELEEYDRAEDAAFYAAADTMQLMADRLLKNGSINSATYEKVVRKYPIGE